MEKDKPKPEDYDIDIEKELENKFDELFGRLEWGNYEKKKWDNNGNPYNHPYNICYINGGYSIWCI